MPTRGYHAAVISKIISEEVNSLLRVFLYVSENTTKIAEIIIAF
jgi:hypothetical protein